MGETREDRPIAGLRRGRMDDRQVRQFKCLEHLNNSLSIYEEETKTTFVSTKKDKCFGKRGEFIIDVSF